MRAVKAVKGVKFHYRQTPQTRKVLETFRTMVNHAIHICLEEGIPGRLKLRNRIYREFQERYGVVSCYPYSVAEVAWSIVKKHKRWQRRPFADKLMMKIKRGQTCKGVTNVAFLWNVMDRKTRILLASTLSQHRNVNGAVAVFNPARRNANGSEPEKIFADGLNVYPQAMAYWESESERP